MKVVQLHSQDYGGGAEAVVRLNHQGLSGLGHTVQTLVGRKGGRDDYIDEIPYVRGFPGSRRLARFAEKHTGLQYIYSPSFRQVQKRFRDEPDVVHLHALHSAGGWADHTGLKKLQDCYPTVCTLNDLWWLSGHCAYGMECERWKTGCGSCPDLVRYPSIARDNTHCNWQRKKRLVAKSRLHFIAPSQWVKSQAAASPILEDSPVYMVPNPIDTTVFCPGSQIESREQLGVPTSAKVVMLAANHLSSRFKGTEDAIRVLGQLGSANVFVILVGRGSDLVSQLIPQASLSLGYVSNSNVMAQCYRAADVFLMPSRAETFGLVAAEATACGAAVVSYRAGGLQEVTLMAEGFVVNDDCTEGLLAGLMHLLENPKELKARVAIGQARVLQEYSPRRHAAACLAIYEHAIASCPR
jgi:glycosyltransferase involved in cell wall biosynthesis